ncbi:MAG: hypothetical protein JWM91_596 [Rhodospirillales bacterium]|nr:hypothetical protein [Rhodospirillales bacterium]
MTFFFRWLCRERAQRAGQPMCEYNRGPFPSRHRGRLRVPGGPRRGPTQRPHEGRRPTAPPEDPSLRQPLYPRHHRRAPPRPVPMVSRVLTRSEPGKPPPTPGHNVRRVFYGECYHTGFKLRPPLEIGLMSRARKATSPISAGRSLGLFQGLEHPTSKPLFTASRRRCRRRCRMVAVCCSCRAPPLWCFTFQ